MSYWTDRKNLAQIEYHGIAGITRFCLEAITRLIHFGNQIGEAKLLTYGGHHCFLLKLVMFEALGHYNYVAVKAGFSSGYHGEGPRGLSIALQLLECHAREIKHHKIPKAIFERLNNSCLLVSDLDTINSIQEVVPLIWREYIYERGYILDKNYLRSDIFPQTIPYGIVDTRIIDLAIKFDKDPDSSLISAYRRLEDIVRNRTGLSESSSKLFSQSFQGKDSMLYWGDIDVSEQLGRASLFTAVYMAFRNRRSHRELNTSAAEGVREFMLLNELYLLEAQAVFRPADL